MRLLSLSTQDLLSPGISNGGRKHVEKKIFALLECRCREQKTVKVIKVEIEFSPTNLNINLISQFSLLF